MEAVNWTSVLSRLTLVPIAGSAVVWLWVLRQFAAHQPVLSSRFRLPSGKVPPAVLALTLSWLGLNVWMRIQHAGEAATIDLGESLRSVLYLELGLLGVMLLLISALADGPTELARLGFRTDELTVQATIGVIGFLASLLPVMGMLWLTSWVHQDEQHELLQYLQDEGFSRLLLPALLLAVLVAPLLEELCFRVVLQNWLTGLFGVRGGIVLASCAFAAVHETGIPSIFVLSLIVGYVFQRSRSYVAAVVLHSLFNAFNIASLYVQLVTGEL